MSAPEYPRPPRGHARLFVDVDGWGALAVWEHLPDRPDYPQPRLYLDSVGDESLRNFIVAAIERGDVQ